jgi:hypothetical protein
MAVNVTRYTRQCDPEELQDLTSCYTSTCPGLARTGSITGGFTHAIVLNSASPLPPISVCAICSAPHSHLQHDVYCVLVPFGF